MWRLVERVIINASVIWHSVLIVIIVIIVIAVIVVVVVIPVAVIVVIVTSVIIAIVILATVPSNGLSIYVDQAPTVCGPVSLSSTIEAFFSSIPTPLSKRNIIGCVLIWSI